MVYYKQFQCLIGIGENLTTIDINAKREWLKQNKELQMSTVNAIKVDLKGIDLIRKESLKDMRFTSYMYIFLLYIVYIICIDIYSFIN